MYITEEGRFPLYFYVLFTRKQQKRVERDRTTYDSQSNGSNWSAPPAAAISNSQSQGPLFSFFEFWLVVTQGEQGAVGGWEKRRLIKQILNTRAPGTQKRRTHSEKKRKIGSGGRREEEEKAKKQQKRGEKGPDGVFHGPWGGICITDRVLLPLSMHYAPLIKWVRQVAKLQSASPLVDDSKVIDRGASWVGGRKRVEFSLCLLLFSPCMNSFRPDLPHACTTCSIRCYWQIYSRATFIHSRETLNSN